MNYCFELQFRTPGYRLITVTTKFTQEMVGQGWDPALWTPGPGTFSGVPAVSLWPSPSLLLALSLSFLTWTLRAFVAPCLGILEQELQDWFRGPVSGFWAQRGMGGF